MMKKSFCEKIENFVKINLMIVCVLINNFEVPVFFNYDIINKPNIVYQIDKLDTFFQINQDF